MKVFHPRYESGHVIDSAKEAVEEAKRAGTYLTLKHDGIEVLVRPESEPHDLAVIHNLKLQLRSLHAIH